MIVAIGGPGAALAAKETTSTIPIVFAMGGDAVDSGLVKSLNKPEANVTGMGFRNSQLAPKRLELLSELVPQAELFGYLDNIPGNKAVQKDLVERARSIRREVAFFYAGTEQEIVRAFEAMVQQRVGALVVSSDAYLLTRHEQIVSLAQVHALPTIYSERGAQQGELISYEVLVREMFHQAGVYVDRILRGANPADLPVQLATKFKLVINLKTAKALDLNIPPSLLARADEVIE